MRVILGMIGKVASGVLVYAFAAAAGLGALCGVWRFLLPGHGEGDKCSWSWQCEGNLVCSPISKCEKGVRDAPCRKDDDCVSEGLVCNNAEKRCLPPAVAGEPCAEREDCESSLVCDLDQETPACASAGDVELRRRPREGTSPPRSQDTEGASGETRAP